MGTSGFSRQRSFRISGRSKVRKTVAANSVVAMPSFAFVAGSIPSCASSSAALTSSSVARSELSVFKTSSISLWSSVPRVELPHNLGYRDFLAPSARSSEISNSGIESICTPASSSSRLGRCQTIFLRLLASRVASPCKYFPGLYIFCSDCRFGQDPCSKLRWISAFEVTKLQIDDA